MIRKYISTVLFALITLLSQAQFIEATEWCPVGTWWCTVSSYTSKPEQRANNYFLCYKDTTIEGSKAKIIKSLTFFTNLTVLPSTKALDTFTVTVHIPEGIRKGEEIRIKKGDSIFGSEYKTNLPLKFKFLYRVKYNEAERQLYQTKIAENCTTKLPYYIHDTLITKIYIDTSVNQQNQKVILKYYKNSMVYKNYYTYNESNEFIYHNILPLYEYEYGIYAKFYAHKADSILNKLNPADVCNKYTYGFHIDDLSRIYTGLMCYFQGNAGYLIDRYAGGEEKSGCEYFRKMLENKSSITNIYQAPDIVFYPNPTQDLLNIESNVSNLKLVIQNAQGVKCQVANLSKNISIIDISQLTSGVYILYFLDSKDRAIKTSKLIKN